MKEPIFILKNQSKWKNIEQALKQQTVSTDDLASYYITLSDDLAFAQTYYPQSEVTLFLNKLTSEYHATIYKNRKEKTSRLKTFWAEEVPLEMYKARKQMLYAFIVFIVSSLIGAFSAHYDHYFVRLILGDAYVNMTLENIANGTPMAVYESGSSFSMFFHITTNNIRVSFLAFAMGIFSSFGTGFLLFRNGVMLGSFQYFFFQKDVLGASLLSIWTHGTLEITAIVLAGGAGFILGNSMLFPKSLPRSYSLKQGAKSGLKIIIGLMPVFIIAGFLEGFVTRQVDWHISIRLAFILSSIAFIIFYYFIYASKLYHDRRTKTQLQKS